MRWKCDLAGQVSVILHLLQVGLFRVLTTFPLQNQSSWQLPFLELPPCRNTVTPSSDMYTSTAQSDPHLLMLHCLPTIVFKLIIPFFPILYLLPLPLTTVSCFWLFFYASCLLSLLTLSGFFNGMLEVFETGAMNYFTFFRPILSTLSAFGNSILTHLPLSGSLDSLLCVLIAPTPGLAFYLLMRHTLVATSSFLSGRVYLSLNFLPPLFLRSIPTLIM